MKPLYKVISYRISIEPEKEIKNEDKQKIHDIIMERGVEDILYLNFYKYKAEAKVILKEDTDPQQWAKDLTARIFKQYTSDLHIQVIREERIYASKITVEET